MDDLRILRAAWEEPAPAAAAARASARGRLLELAGARGAGQEAGPGRRARRPRMRLWLAAAAVAATAAAAGAVLVAGPAATAPATGAGGLPPVTTAYVIGRTKHALAAAEHRNLIERVRTVSQGSGTGFIILGPGPGRSAVVPQAVSWYYRGMFRMAGFTAAGRRVFDASHTDRYGPERVTISSENVNYISRTWWRGEYHGSRAGLTPGLVAATFVPGRGAAGAGQQPGQRLARGDPARAVLRDLPRRRDRMGRWRPRHQDRAQIPAAAAGAAAGVPGRVGQPVDLPADPGPVVMAAGSRAARREPDRGLHLAGTNPGQPGIAAGDDPARIPSAAA